MFFLYQAVAHCCLLLCKTFDRCIVDNSLSALILLMANIQTNFDDNDLEVNLLQALNCKYLESGEIFIGNVIFDKPHGPGELE